MSLVLGAKPKVTLRVQVPNNHILTQKIGALYRGCMGISRV